ncbi:hypothetical protein [Pelagerythrobacter sp.]|uniref:hypothetical protein n=1 Tax=Pelagerythrobacter sp. TaxID=2800702 RepID=UPI0035B01144
MRGLLTIAGRSVASLQLDLALRLGCERVVCLADGLGEGTLPLLHRAEGAGASFHALSGARALSGLVRAQDELFVFAEGVVPDPPLVGELLGERSGIVALPAEAGVEAGFERIDRDHAWAGLARLPGSTVERLAEMPVDVDIVSALLRVGLQSGVRLVPLARSHLTNRDWVYLRDESQARAFENAWLRQRVAPVSFAAPAYALADRAAMALAPRVLARRGRSALPLVGGIASLAGALAAAWWKMPALAFGATALAAFLLRMGGTLGALARSERDVGWLGRVLRGAPAVAVDAAIVVLVELVAPATERPGWIFAGGMLLMGLRLVERLGSDMPSRVASDRTVLAGIIALAAVAGQILPVIQLLALISLIVLYFVSAPRRITRV